MIPACCNAVGGRPITANGNGPVAEPFAAVVAVAPIAGVPFPPDTFVQIPFVTAGPSGGGIVAAPPNILFPFFGGSYDVEYHLVLQHNNAPPSISSIQSVLSLNGSPTGPGTAILPTGDEDDLISDQASTEVSSMNGCTLATIAPGDSLGLWVRIVGGPVGFTMVIAVGSFEAVRVGP